MNKMYVIKVVCNNIQHKHLEHKCFAENKTKLCKNVHKHKMKQIKFEEKVKNNKSCKKKSTKFRKGENQGKYELNLNCLSKTSEWRKWKT